MAHIPEQLREFAERYTKAWCSQDPERAASLYAPHGSLTINAAWRGHFEEAKYERQLEHGGGSYSD